MTSEKLYFNKTPRQLEIKSLNDVKESVLEYLKVWNINASIIGGNGEIKAI